jgi:hypothetical protein
MAGLVFLLEAPPLLANAPAIVPAAIREVLRMKDRSES